MTTPLADPYRRHRFPARVIAQAVWLYHTFALSPRDVALVLTERGVDVSHESIRRWCARFGRAFAERLRRRRPRPGATWHLDEVFARAAAGRRLYLWRAVDQRGAVPGTLAQARRDARGQALPGAAAPGRGPRAASSGVGSDGSLPRAKRWETRRFITS
jgi:transposase-like protein